MEDTNSQPLVDSSTSNVKDNKNTPTQPRFSNRLLIITGIIVALLLLGTGVGAYYLNLVNTDRLTNDGIIPNKKNASLKDNIQADVNKPNNHTSYQTYSNGWYDYTIKYPSSAFLRYSGNKFHSRYIFTHAIDVREKPLGNDSYPCSISVIQRGEESNGDESIITESPDVSQVIFNDLKWKKLEYTSSQNDLFYENEGIKWQFEGEDFTYVVSSHQSNESFCESVISSIKFNIDESIPSAKAAKKVKQLATEYAKSRYPEKRFWEGWFATSDSLAEEEQYNYDVLMTTDWAIAVFVDPRNNKYPENKGIIYYFAENDWHFYGETDQPY